MDLGLPLLVCLNVGEVDAVQDRVGGQRASRIEAGYRSSRAELEPRVTAQAL